MKNFIRALIPAPLLNFYHLTLAYAGALRYGFPSRKLFVVAITGTKGKSTTVELVASVLRAAEYKVAAASTIRFAIGEESERNLYKMTMPGRFFLQRFLRRAVNAGCTHAVIETTSEGAAQHRHRCIALDALVFLNLAPEHLESHGGLGNYVQAKLSLARHLERSPKRPRYLVANADDAHGEKFLSANVERRVPFSLNDAEPYNADEKSLRFVWKRGELFTVPLPGLFNVKNCLAALALCEAMGVPLATIKKGLERVEPIPGRAQRIEQGQPFAVIVDYAHTPNSLEALFETYKHRRLLCVFGATGGGRDRWKRPEMGKMADTYCNISILTNDDPYDENPRKILKEIAEGFSRTKPQFIIDRRAAIRKALSQAEEGDAVLIAGKGTDPYIMGPRGSKEPWSDAAVAQEELQKLGYH